MEKGVQVILFHAWSSDSAKALGKALSVAKYRGTIHMGVAPFTSLPGGLTGLATNMGALRQFYSGPLAVCVFLSFHDELLISETKITQRAGDVQKQLSAVTGSATQVSICPMLEDEWGGNQTKVSSMLAAAASPFVINGYLQQPVSLRRSSNDNPYVPTSLSVSDSQGKMTTIQTQIKLERHGMGPIGASWYYSNDGNFVCMEAEPAGLKKPLPYLEAKDSATNPSHDDDAHKFTLAQYLGVSAHVNLLWRPMYNLYPVNKIGPDKVNNRPKAIYNMAKSGRSAKNAVFNEVEAACLARFLAH